MTFAVSGTFTGVAQNTNHNTNSYYDLTKTVYKNGSRHKTLERNLWFINGVSFLAALPFYPIVSSCGHALIECKYGNENSAYGKVKNYLDDKLSSFKKPFYLNQEDLSYIQAIFEDYKVKKGYVPFAIERALTENTWKKKFTYGFGRKDVAEECTIFGN